jgi:hypothetical protein
MIALQIYHAPHCVECSPKTSKAVQHLTSSCVKPERELLEESETVNALIAVRGYESSNS